MPEPPHLRRPWVIGGVFLIAVIATAAALALRVTGSDSVVLAPTSTYTEGVAGTWQRINPIFATSNEVDADISRLVFAGLLKAGPEQDVRPDLADLPEVSGDGLSYTFRLKDGLKWHDGEPLTASDVAFTIHRIQDASFRGDEALADSWEGVGIDTPDDHTVVFHLQQPSAPFLARNATIGILPEHLLGQLTAQQLYDAPFNAAPVGSGPYRVESINDAEAVLRAFGDYHEGRPKIDRFRVRFYDDYPSALRAANGGEIDGLLLREVLSEAQSTEVAKMHGMEATPLERTAHIILYLNNDKINLSDSRVRKAISIAVDRRAIVAATFFGGATASSSAIPPGSWAYDAEYDQLDVDLAEAKQLLTDAGWKANPTTGILIHEGEEFRMTIRTDNDPIRVAVAESIRRQLEPLGIRASVISTTFAVLRRDFLQERKYDAAVTGWDQGADPDPYFAWHSSQTGTAGLNIGNFADIVVDELIAKARTANDLEVRKEQYRQFQEKWEQLAPGVVIAYPQYLYVHRSSLEGVEPGLAGSGADRFWNVAQWTF